MSGGSYDYAYQHIDDLADELRCMTPLRRAFKAHLRLVAQAAHQIEWVDSGDCSPGDDDAAIRAALGQDADGLSLQEIVSEAQKCLLELQEAIKNTKSQDAKKQPR